MAAIRIQPLMSQRKFSDLASVPRLAALILIGVVSVSSSFNAASVLIALGAVAVLGEWIVSRSYTVGVGIGILGIFPLVGEIPVDLRFIGGAAVKNGRCRRLPARATPQRTV